MEKCPTFPAQMKKYKSFWEELTAALNLQGPPMRDTESWKTVSFPNKEKQFYVYNILIRTQVWFKYKTKLHTINSEKLTPLEKSVVEVSKKNAANLMYVLKHYGKLKDLNTVIRY